MWRSVFLVEETGVPWENHQPYSSQWQTLSHNDASSTLRLSVIRTDNISNVRYWIGSCKSNHPMITTTNSPLHPHRLSFHNTKLWNNLHHCILYFNSLDCCLHTCIKYILQFSTVVYIPAQNVYFNSLDCCLHTCTKCILQFSRLFFSTYLYKMYTSIL